jgi:hypothetical protein
MTAARNERAKAYVAIGLAFVLVGVGYVRFFHKKTGPHADQATAAPAYTEVSVPQVKVQNVQKKARRHESPGKNSMRAVLRDIFAPVKLDVRAETQTAAEEVQEPVPSFQFGGVIVGGGSPLAIINDQIVRLGDWIGSYKVLRIENKEVVLGSDTKTLVLQLEKNE